MLLPLLMLAASASAADSTRWIVSNHGREAGDLVVLTNADSAIARWVFTDRNRGTAGIPVPTALQIATIIAARRMREEKDYGSVRPGKIADILGVDGRPAEHISDLQKIETVIRGGRLHKVSDLNVLAGLAGR